MTIIFFSRLFYLHIGGVEKHVLEVGKRLVKKGHRIIVITEETYQSKSSSARMTGEVKNIEIHRIDVGKENFLKKFRIWWELWKYKDLIKKADIVHCHDVFFWYLPFRFLYPNRPIYTTFHGHETKFPPSKKAILIRKISEKLSWGNICVGDYIGKWYGSAPTFVTYGGIEIRNPIRQLTGEIRNKFKTQNSKIKIVFIGRLEEDTGITIYLKALDLLKTKNIQFEFEVCGDGSLSGMAEQYGRVHGFAEDLGIYLRQADVVFASSYLSILEAMKQKKLVLAVYDNPLKEDYLKMSPFARWIVIEDSPKDLADNILYFSNHDDEKEKIINKGYEWVKTQTWENVVTMYLNLWHIPFRHSYTDTGSEQIRRFGIPSFW